MKIFNQYLKKMNEPEKLVEYVQPKMTTKYFDLMHVVGTAGKYQMRMVLILSILAVVNGCITLGAGFFLYLPQYQNCPEQYSRTSDSCRKYVCSLPGDQREQYLPANYLRTFGNVIEDFNCEDIGPLMTISNLNGIGTILGYLLLPLITDNLGRKTSFLMSLVAGITGTVIIYSCNNMTWIAVGFFINAIGSNSGFNTLFTFIDDTVDNHLRQQYSVVFLVAYSGGGLLNLAYFYFLGNVKLIFLICYVIPLILCFVLVILFVKETPQFLIRRYADEEILQVFKSIAETNGKISEFEESALMKPQHFDKLRNDFEAEMQFENKMFFTPIDLFRYKSLRSTTVCTILLGAILYYVYYGPQFFINQFGFNVFLGNGLISLSEMSTYFINFTYIEVWERKKVALVLFGLTGLSSFVLFFVYQNPSQISNGVSLKLIVEVIFLFVLRFCTTLQFNVFQTYSMELFPVRVFGTGLGIYSIAGTMGTTYIPLGFKHFPVMAVFVVFSLAGMLISMLLPETYGAAPREEVQEMEEEMYLQDKQNRQIQYNSRIIERYKQKV